MGKKKGKSGGQAGQGQQVPVDPSSATPQPSASAATTSRPQEQSVPQPQQQQQVGEGGGGRGGQQTGRGGAWGGRGGSGGYQQPHQEEDRGRQQGQQRGGYEGGGGQGGRGGQEGGGGQGGRGGRGGGGGQQRGGGGDGHPGGYQRCDQLLNLLRGSPSPSHSASGDGQYGHRSGSSGTMEQGRGGGRGDGRGGGRGDGRGGGRGGDRGDGRGGRGAGQQQRYQADAPPVFYTQQFPSFSQWPVQPQQQSSAQAMPQLVQQTTQLQVQEPAPVQQRQQQQQQPQQQQQQRQQQPQQQQQQPQQQQQRQQQQQQRQQQQPQQQQQRQQQQPQQQQQRQAASAAAVGIKTAQDVPEEVPANFRKGGTQGRKIKVAANHFQVSLSPKTTKAYQYDVALDPDKPKKLLPLVMQQVQRTYYPNNHPAFDGMKNLFSARELPMQMPFNGAIQIMEDDREKEYKVKIQFAAEVDISALAKFFNQHGENHMLPPMHVLQCLDIVLRSRPSTTMIIAGRSYFSVPERIVTLGNGMEMYRGFYQSAILGWKPFLNVDVSHKAFPTRMPILDLIRELDNRVDLKNDLMRNTVEKLSKFLYNLKVEYKIPNLPASKRNYRVNGLEQSASRFKFKNDDGVEMTVASYFQDVKRYKLQFPHLPCVWVGSKQRTPRMVLPCELCVVLEGQVTNRKMDDIQTRNMIKEAATSTNVRKDHIMRSMRVANHNASPAMQEFGLTVDPNMTEVTARVLQPPTIKYKTQRQEPIMARVAKGVWRGGIFWQPSQVLKWAIVCMDDKIYDKQLSELRELFVKQGAIYGMSISNDARITKLSVMRNGQKEMYNYFDTCKREQLQLIVVVLLDFNKSCYSWVKKAAELQTGCLTQCIKSNTMRRMNTQIVDNILLKINAKLNGINHVLGEKPLMLRKPVMIMGADVTHPSPEARDNTPSVAAVTASHDPQAFYYNIEWRLQDSRVEIISDLETITREQLLFFRKKTNCKPERIIFYRDGVSDGQFEAVRRMEIQAIRNACKSLEDNTYQPAITFLVVQKRHHTRLFPCDPRDSEDRNVNVPAGTCVDTQITHPTAQDFYLVSHASIQGVAKPTKYRTIWDDSNFTDDDIEQLTYYLCHMFARCNRSVSYPAPTYYAHLAAARAKVYIEDQNLDMRTLKTMHERLPITEIIQKEHPMFFV